MQDVKLGRLQRVSLRDIWESEPGDFTPWLAGGENLDLLGETIGIDLELEATEKNVGPFRADILCKDTASGAWVLVENQLEATDHTHLGQLLTYAAGLEAVTIVWLAAGFTEEHRATLDWLNQITDDRFAFFGLEIELWRIGDSLVAPKFNIISKPNDWSSSVSKAASAITDGPLTEVKALQLTYWTAFRDFLIKRRSPVKPTKPYPQHWMNASLGRSGFLLEALMNTSAQRIGVGLYINATEATAFFKLIEQQKAAIEAELGVALDWMELPHRKACRIVLYKKQVEPLQQDQWEAHMSWMQNYLEKFAAIFGPRVKVLNADDWKPPTEVAAQ